MTSYFLKDEPGNMKLLVHGLRKGDQEAFKKLVDTYQLSIIRICRGYVRSEDDAKDIAQEVFIEVYRSIKKFRAKSTLTTWIHRIAVNKSLNYIRNNKKYINQSIELSTIFNLSDHSVKNQTAETTDEPVNRKDHALALHMALDSLPAKQRTAFILREYEDLSYNEIADILQSSLSSVESLLFRARQNLRKKLYGYYKNNIQ